MMCPFHLAQRLLTNRTSQRFAHGTEIMHCPKRIERALSSVGVVHHVDTVNREAAVFIESELLFFDVSIGCKIVLHGEPVKFRLIQPQDRVRITHTSRGGRRVALAIEVQPDRCAGHVSHIPPGGSNPAGARNSPRPGFTERN